MSTRFSSGVVMTVARAPLFALLALPLAAQSADRLAGKNVSIAQTNDKAPNAIQLMAKPEAANGTSYSLVKDVSFRDGVIEVDLAGQPASAAFAGARGFIGIAFRLQDDGAYEYIFLRPTNGRADDQVRRNHSPNTGRTRTLASPDRARRLRKSTSPTSRRRRRRRSAEQPSCAA